MTNLLIRILLPMGVVGALFYLLLLPLRPLLARLSARWWKMLLIVCAALFLFPLPFAGAAIMGHAAPGEIMKDPVANTATTPAYTAGRALNQLMDPLEENVNSSQSLLHDKEPSPVTPATALAYLYTAGLAAMLVWQLGKYGKLLRHLRRHSQPVTDKTILTLYDVLCHDMAIAKPPRLLHSGQVVSPLLVGVVRSRILLPDTALTDTQLSFALRHELFHHKNNDLLLKHVLFAASALHWYNPAAHFLRRDFAEACEQSCDESVVRQLSANDRQQYAAILLDFTNSAPSSLVSAFASPAKRLRVRLARLLRPATPGVPLKTLGAALPCLLLAGALLVGCSFAAGTQTQNASLPPSQTTSTTAPPSPSSAPSASSLAELPDAPANSTPVVLSTAGFSNPVPSATHIIRYKDGHHRGIDLSAETGDPIYAVGAGTVLTSGWHDSYGNYIVIDHGSGLSSLYAHNSELFVAEGEHVETGQRIAAVGATGNSSGTHCHIEFIQDELLMDPADYLPFPDGFSLAGSS